MTNWTWLDSRVVRVVDGDTIIAVLRRDLGFEGTIEFQQRLRLVGINTPPAHTEEGERATEFVRGFTSGPVTIITHKPYKYGGEWMADVLAGAKSLSTELMARGLAQPWSGKGPRPGG